MSNSGGQDLRAKFNVSNREQIEGELARMSDESAVVPRMFSRPSSAEHARPAKIMRSLFRCVDRLRTEMNTLLSELEATQSQSIPRLTYLMEPIIIKLSGFRWNNGFFEIPRRLALAVFDLDDIIVLHRRPAVDKLYQELSQRSYALVKGPSECGKSTCVFAMALEIASGCSESAVLWIRGGTKEFLIIKKSEIQHFAIPLGSWDPLISIVNSGSIMFKSIYIDQCRLNDRTIVDDSNLLRFLLDGWKRKDESRGLYAITSACCNDFRDADFIHEDIVKLTPWTLDEYREVLKNERALEKFARSFDLSEIAPDDLINKANIKFYYAGISARFFFDWNISAITRCVDYQFRQIRSFDTLFNEDIREASPVAVNTLFHKVDGSYRFNSRYIIDSLFDLMYVSPRTFTSMIPMLGSRPHKGTVGVLFELYTLSIIKHSGWDPLAHVPGMTYRVPMGTNLRFGRYKDGRVVEIQLGQWYKPYKICNGGFDAFIAFGSHSKGKLEELVIVFVQVTRDELQDFNPQHFATAAIEISKRIKGFDPPPDKGPLTRSRKNSAVENQAKLRIEIIFAIPTGRSDFTVNKVDVLAPLKNLDKRWKLNKLIIAQVPNSSAFLDNEISVAGSLF